MVVVILGIIGAIALPRLGRLGESAGESALIHDLAVIARAVEQYKAEHAGSIPTSEEQLTQYSDAAGNTSETPGGPFIYGPYLHKMPELPVGDNKGETGIVATGSPGQAAGAGWWIDPGTGDVRANAKDAELTRDGKPINTLKPGDLVRE
jgi:type II secretory pathway pseudopilin PulG